MEFTTEFTGLYRKQETPVWDAWGSASACRVARAAKTRLRRIFRHTGISRYRFRSRIRNVDALRPIGSNMDESQVASRPTPRRSVPPWSGIAGPIAAATRLARA
jgi:hypothetical protein